MKNTENTTTPEGYSRAALIEALRLVTESPQHCRVHLVLTPNGWEAASQTLIDRDADLVVMDREGLVYEAPQDYAPADYEGLLEHVESNIWGWALEAIDGEVHDVAIEESYRAQLEQRPVNPNATSERLEALRTILANLKRA